MTASNTAAVPQQELWEKDHSSEAIDINAMLAGREEQYGSFADFSAVNRRIVAAMKLGNSWGHLTDAQQVALEMIAHKVSRILNGDPGYVDNWVDIAGYAQLVVNIQNERG